MRDINMNISGEMLKSSNSVFKVYLLAKIPTQV